jgi:hypothetical protein
MATEAVLVVKLGENEVVEAIYFGTNQQKKLRRSEHPTRRDLISALSMNSLREIGNKRDAVFLLILFPYGKSKRRHSPQSTGQPFAATVIPSEARNLLAYHLPPAAEGGVRCAAGGVRRAVCGGRYATGGMRRAVCGGRCAGRLLAALGKTVAANGCPVLCGEWRRFDFP